MTSILKNGVTLVGLALIAALGYYLFVMKGDSNTTLSSKTEIGEAKLASEQFLKELDAIKTFKLSDTIFSDQRFRSFVDFTKPIPNQPVGRENPFAPVQ